MCRAQGDLAAALAAVSGALRIDPLGFVPLLLKANLLERLGRRAEAGETYGHALAQAPAAVPPHLEAMVAHARAAPRRACRRARRAARRGRAPTSALSRGRAGAALARFRTNMLRTTRPLSFASRPISIIPASREREFHDRDDFPWLAALEAATAAITEDFQRVMAAERAELVPYIQYPDDVPLRQWAALNRNRAWTAIHLVQNGVTIEANARHCPTVMALLGGLDQPDIAAARPQRDVLAARAGRAYPAPQRRRQYPPGLPPAADRAAGLLVPGRRRNAANGRSARPGCSTTRSSMRR